LPAQQLLDHHARTGVAERAFAQHRVHRGQRFLDVLGHHHPLAGGQPVRLDHEWAIALA
jgi:hypothetical protein